MCNVITVLQGTVAVAGPNTLEETEDNLVLDFSNGGPPSLVISTADQPKAS